MLCIWYSLDPATATAADVDAAIRRQAYARAMTDVQIAVGDLVKENVR